MNTLRRLALIGILSFVVGCTTYSNHHYSLMDEPNINELQYVSNQIKITIEPILGKFGLVESKTDEMPKNVLLYYSSGGDSALRVGIRTDKGKVIFDSFQYRSGAGDSPEYRQLKEELISALKTINRVEFIEIDGPII